MKDILVNLNKVFENRIRLGAMSLLVVHEWIEFNRLKEILDVTDGNLASHIAVLEKHNYLEVKKEFVARKPLTRYRATETGKKAFAEHLTALEKLIKSNQEFKEVPS